MDKTTPLPCSVSVDSAEKIAVTRVRIWRRDNHSSVILGALDMANAVVASWTRRCKGRMECDYEIVFADHSYQRGTYTFQRKEKERRTFTTHVRRNLSSAGSLTVENSSGATTNETCLLDRYEL